MFENCSKLTSLDLSHFMTSQVTDMSNLFSNCINLEKLKINFDTKKVEKMQFMFNSCTKLKSLNLSSFSTEKCTNFREIFENDEGLDLYINNNTCSNLVAEIPYYVNVIDTSNNYEN